MFSRAFLVIATAVFTAAATSARNEHTLRDSSLPTVIKHSKIVWCQQSYWTPWYNLTTGANCPERSTLIDNPMSYRDFRREFCLLKKKDLQQHIKFKHVRRIKYGSSRFANLAYTTLKWSIVNLRPDPDNLWLEFGVAGGYSINLTSYMKEKVMESTAPVYGFDWFRGLPEQWFVTEDKYLSQGTFTQKGIIPPTRSTVRLIPGLFNQTLDDFLRIHTRGAHKKKISFVNMDMDLYSGAKYVLERLVPHLAPGAVIHFHDFFTSDPSSCEGSHEMKALYEVMYVDMPGTLQLQMMPFETVGFREPIVFRVIQ